ncbi:MAG: hypothetical protein P0S95_01845 [Rhabdochlamydiaceae bacterium]|nr:hypothetical protein [Candidatus Amphrikana amoebophyrae]
MIGPIQNQGAHFNRADATPSFEKVHSDAAALLLDFNQLSQTGSLPGEGLITNIASGLQTMALYFQSQNSAHRDSIFTNPSLNLLGQLLNSLQKNIGITTPTALDVLSGENPTPNGESIDTYVGKILDSIVGSSKSPSIVTPLIIQCLKGVNDLPSDSAPSMVSSQNCIEYSKSYFDALEPLFNSITTHYPQYGTLPPNNEPNIAFVQALNNSPVIKSIMYQTITNSNWYLDLIGSANWPSNGSANIINQIFNFFQQNGGDSKNWPAEGLANLFQEYYFCLESPSQN